jgi:hypothetical protein
MPLTEIQRYSLFLIGCIGLRSLLAYSAYYLSNSSTGGSVNSESSKKLLRILAIIAILIGISFFTIYLTGSRKTGIETGGQKIWWNNQRPIFGVLWLSFGITALLGYKWCWIFLLLDVLLGLTSFLNHHFLKFF